MRKFSCFESVTKVNKGAFKFFRNNVYKIKKVRYIVSNTTNSRSRDYYKNFILRWVYYY